MDNEELALEKLRLISDNPCLRITPYMEFEDGTKGSVLLLGFNDLDSMLFLFNSPERNDENEHGKDNTLSPSEVDCFYNYRQVCIKEYDSYYRISPEIYEKYGVVLLTGKYLSAHIADFFCHNLNIHNPRRNNFQTDRVQHLISNAVTHYNISEMEEDITEFLSDDSKWRRDITLQALRLYKADEIFEKGLHIDWIRVRNTHVGWLEREEVPFKLYFAQQALKSFRELGKPENWRRQLENALNDKLEKRITFHYLDYGIQEIIGLYALSKHLYTEKPEYFEIQYAPVDTKERVAIFKEYMTACTSEMLEKLNAEDNPLRTELPTEEEAAIEAKKYIAKLVGRQPIYLPEDQKTRYAQYEEGFCKSQGIDYVPQKKEQLAIAKDEYPDINAMEFYDYVAPDIQYNIPVVVEDSDGGASIISRPIYTQKNIKKFKYILSDNEKEINEIHARIEKHLSTPAELRDELGQLQKEKLVSLPMDKPTEIIREVLKIWGKRAPKERSFVTSWGRRH